MGRAIIAVLITLIIFIIYVITIFIKHKKNYIYQLNRVEQSLRKISRSSGPLPQNTLDMFGDICNKFSSLPRNKQICKCFYISFCNNGIIDIMKLHDILLELEAEQRQQQQKKEYIKLVRLIRKFINNYKKLGISLDI